MSKRSLRVLCLHGQGTSSEILRLQLAPYLFRLQRELGLTFHFVNGRRECAAHPSLAGLYSGKTYQNYSWDDDHGPPTEENKTAVEQAFEHVYKVIDDEGPFDGALGFSQGSSCLTGLLLNHERQEKGLQSDLFGFVILFSTSGVPEWDLSDEDKVAKIRIPSLHVCSEADSEWFADSKAVVDRCVGGQLLLHGGGHAIPKDRPSVDKIIKGFQELLARAKI